MATAGAFIRMALPSHPLDPWDAWLVQEGEVQGWGLYIHIPSYFFYGYGKIKPAGLQSAGLVEPLHVAVP